MQEERGCWNVRTFESYMSTDGAYACARTQARRSAAGVSTCRSRATSRSCCCSARAASGRWCWRSARARTSSSRSRSWRRTNSCRTTTSSAPWASGACSCCPRSRPSSCSSAAPSRPWHAHLLAYAHAHAIAVSLSPITRTCVIRYVRNKGFRIPTAVTHSAITIKYLLYGLSR